MESYSVEAILTATDRTFSSTMSSAERSMAGVNKQSGELGDGLDKSTTKGNQLGKSILSIGAGVGAVKLVSTAVNMVKDSVEGAINRFDTLNKYPVVMKALGYSTEDVDRSMTKLSDGIDGLPTSLDEIVSNTQQLAISTGSLSKGTDTAIALNDAFLASELQLLMQLVVCNNIFKCSVRVKLICSLGEHYKKQCRLRWIKLLSLSKNKV